MSSLMASTTATAAIPVAGGGSSNSASSLINNGPIIPPMAAQFREIHKNTWLKRLTAEGKKICVGPKKSERSWVVFCVHDDTEALLEGYAEPRQAPSHNPEWIVSMQDTLHISHALIPNSHEFEFVVTLSNEVVRFHAMSWDIMQEWVETLRSKLREMKILSPRENLYTKLPEVRAPLLPTRDPTSPLPAPPPVPAALVPGVERVVPPSIQQHQQQQQQLHNSTENSDSESTTRSESSQQQTASNNLNSSSCTSTSTTAACSSNPSTVPVTTAQSISSSTANTSQAPPPLLTSMSNTLTQNLLNMLLDPISAYSEHLNDANSSSSSIEADDMSAVGSLPLNLKSSLEQFQFCNYSSDEEFIGPLLRKPSDPTQSSTSAAASSSSNSVRLDILTGHRVSADQIKNLEHIFQCDSRIPRPHTSRSLSAGAVDKTKLQLNNFNSQKKTEPDGKNNESAGGGGKTVAVTNSKKENNITELEVNSIFETPSSSSTLSSSSSTTSDKNTNITIIQVSTEGNHHQSQHCESNEAAPKLPHKSTMNNAGSTPNNSTAGDVFTFPETYKPTQAKTSMKQQQQLEYKSNVQIIPSTSINSNTPNSNSCSNSNSSSSSSNSTSTIHVLGSNSNMTTATTTKDTTSNSYTTPVRKPTSNTSTSINETEQKQHHKITTVHVAGSDNTYGTCFTPPSSSALSTLNSTSSTPLNTSTPKLPKKIILSANTSGITNIVVNNISDEIMPVIRNNLETENALNSNSKHYDKVFLSTTAAAATVIENSGEQPSTSAALVPVVVAPMSPKYNAQKQKTSQVKTKDATAASCKTTGTVEKSLESHHKSPMSNNVPSRGGRIPMGSPAMPRRRIVSPPTQRINGIVNMPAAQQAPRPPFLLKRGLTEAIISSRPSRRDFHLFNKLQPISKTKSSHPLPASNLKSQASNGNNNGDAPGTSTAKAGSGLPPSAHLAINRTAASDGVEQRRRSSSTDAQSQRQQQQANNATSRGTNNNERQLSSNGAGGVGGPPLRQPPQPFRTTENILGSPSSPGNPSISRDNPQAKQRMTLREQQVMQLRREIMHPGGVRLQLRRKDCVGSIAWVDAFGAVWVAGWKQKEHPVLYNALHIGDQLLSIAGVTISSAAEANKIIRNTNTLFIEVLVRRIPFGRGYAIRRERECQCLGLIRDGNTATIVDVVPNSLAARHGLPPKAQSCDGSTLTFWVLTEINGRPLNPFFKDNEIRDRLNSVGRDISILVQPSDLVTKLKKQLKSLRGYKDYLVQ